MASILVILLLGTHLGGAAESKSLDQQRSPASVQGLHRSGNQILNAANQPVRLRGVNYPSFEYACIQGWGTNGGQANATAVQAMLTWKINVVRLPLNEHCWLDVAGPSPYRGENYRTAVASFVNLLTQNGIAVILDLHWNAPVGMTATEQRPMADRDYSPAFWTWVANTFKSNMAVIFDLFNEPYPDDNVESEWAWRCLRDGGMAPLDPMNPTADRPCRGVPYTAAGMQELVTVVRETGATNLILLAGVTYTGRLQFWRSTSRTTRSTTWPTSTTTHTATATSTPTRTATPTATQPSAGCTPRPPIAVAAVPAGANRLRVTLTASSGAPPHLLQSVQLTRLDNAIVDVGTQTGVTGTLDLLPAVQSLTLEVRRATPGAAITVEAIVRDGCGPWPTSFGGGPTAF